MTWSRLFSTFLAVAALAAAGQSFAQTVPAATQGQLPFTLGAGMSDFAVDWDHQRMLGVTVTAQWRPGFVPTRLYGLGLDVEGRDIDYDRPAASLIPSNFRQDTLLGGPVFDWHHYRKFEPYAKFLAGIGSIDFHSPSPYYNHDTRAVYAPGGGVQYRLAHHFWVRGDYEYQFWDGLFGQTANPNGVTAGVTYDFRSVRHFAGD